MSQICLDTCKSNRLIDRLRINAYFFRIFYSHFNVQMSLYVNSYTETHKSLLPNKELITRIDCLRETYRSMYTFIDFFNSSP